MNQSRSVRRNRDSSGVAGVGWLLLTAEGGGRWREDVGRSP